MTELEKLRKQLKIALDVLKYYENKKKCIKAVEKIEELENEYNLKKVIDNNN